MVNNNFVFLFPLSIKWILLWVVHVNFEFRSLVGDVWVFSICLSFPVQYSKTMGGFFLLFVVDPLLMHFNWGRRGP